MPLRRCEKYVQTSHLVYKTLGSLTTIQISLHTCLRLNPFEGPNYCCCPCFCTPENSLQPYVITLIPSNGVMFFSTYGSLKGTAIKKTTHTVCPVLRIRIPRFTNIPPLLHRLPSLETASPSFLPPP